VPSSLPEIARNTQMEDRIELFAQVSLYPLAAIIKGAAFSKYPPNENGSRKDVQPVQACPRCRSDRLACPRCGTGFPTARTGLHRLHGAVPWARRRRALVAPLYAKNRKSMYTDCSALRTRVIGLMIARCPRPQQRCKGSRASIRGHPRRTHEETTAYIWRLIRPHDA
jgi:hypothetical protein